MDREFRWAKSHFELDFNASMAVVDAYNGEKYYLTLQYREAKPVTYNNALSHYEYGDWVSIPVQEVC